jgi:hypothetical protein
MIQKRGNDNSLIEEADDLPVPSQQGTSGGNLARKVGQRDEEKSATGQDPELTKVNKSDKANRGDMPTPKQTRL